MFKINVSQFMKNLKETLAIFQISKSVKICQKMQKNILTELKN